MHYELGYHSSEATCPHIALVADDGSRNDIVDLRLYFVSDDLDTDVAFSESKSAVELLLDRANESLRRNRT